MITESSITEKRVKSIYKVSVIMSILNGADTMDVAVTSILNQTYKDLEFIICDDGSTDETWMKLEAYAGRDKRIVLLRNTVSQGLAASLDRCLERASGEYIARQDADDRSDSERIEKTIGYLQQNDLPYAACGVRIFDEHGVWSRRIYPECITKHDIVKCNPYFHPTMIFRREVLESVGGYRVARETRRTEDYDLVMRMAAEGVIGRNLQEYLYDVYEEKESYIQKHSRSSRWYEFRTRLYGYRKMRVSAIEYLYLLKPLVLCCIPLGMLNVLKRIQWEMKLKGNNHE